MRFDARQNGTLRVDDREPSLGQQGITQVFIIRVENGRGAYRFLPALRTGEEVTGVIPSMAESRPLPEFTRSIADDLAARLTAAGLYTKEARAMVNTWTSSYFQSEGIRALFVLPQSWTDAFIPMTVVPRPKEIVRVMVGRLELLTTERERLAEAAIGDLTGGDSARRQAAFEFLREQGRYVEPIVRRVMKDARDDAVRTLCRRLLRADFITELRATVHNASDGKRLTSDPVLLRAHLARALREVGSHEAARAEAEAVLAALKLRPVNPGQLLADDPTTVEIRAAAAEAVGDDKKAAAFYARRIEVQLKNLALLDSRTVAWFRDWSVSRAYARCALRAPTARETIANWEKDLGPASHSSGTQTRCNDRTTRVLLALLLDGQGKLDRAQAHWNELSAEPAWQAAAAPAKSLLWIDQDQPGS